MGVFDQEASFELESSPEVGPETETTETATQTNDGHADTDEKETQAPETTEITEEVTKESESKATQEDEKDNKQETKEDVKLLAGRYKTVGGLVNGISEAAKLVGANIDWNKINSPEEMEQVYLELRQQISKGEVKNLIQQQKKGQTDTSPEAIQKEAQIQQSVFDRELAKIIETNTATLNSLETETAEEEDDEEFALKFEENPRKALAERDAKRESRLRKEFEARMNLEGTKLLQTLAPVINRVKEQDEKEAGTAAWEKAVDNFDKVVSSHGDNDLKDLMPEIVDYLKKDPEMYDLVNANPNAPGIREKILSIAYRDIKLNKKLNEFAKTTSEKDTQKIKDSKAGLKIQNGIGGGASATPKKNDELDKVFGTKTESIGVFG